MFDLGDRRHAGLIVVEQAPEHAQTAAIGDTVDGHGTLSTCSGPGETPGMLRHRRGARWTA